MPKIIFIANDGARREVQAAEGTSVMQAAKAADIDGITAECGGSAMCATCHCYVDEAFAGKLPEVGVVESEMLECTASERKPTSRLSCQIKLTTELDGIVIRLPETQV